MQFMFGYIIGPNHPVRVLYWCRHSSHQNNGVLQKNDENISSKSTIKENENESLQQEHENLLQHKIITSQVNCFMKKQMKIGELETDRGENETISKSAEQEVGMKNT